MRDFVYYLLPVYIIGLKSLRPDYSPPRSFIPDYSITPPSLIEEVIHNAPPIFYKTPDSSDPVICDFSQFIDDMCLSCLNTYMSTTSQIIFEILLLLYTFIGLSIAADFVCDSMETSCDRLKISEDVAGATLLAFGGALPEITVNAASTIKEVFSKDVSSQSTSAIQLGVGAVLGSGLIAFLVIPSLCALFGKSNSLRLPKIPLARDTITYFIALCVLVLVINGGITIETSILLIFIYILYLSFLFFGKHLLSKRQQNRPNQLIILPQANVDRQIGDNIISTPLLSEETQLSEEAPVSTAPGVHYLAHHQLRSHMDSGVYGDDGSIQFTENSNQHISRSPRHLYRNTIPNQFLSHHQRPVERGTSLLYSEPLLSPEEEEEILETTVWSVFVIILDWVAFPLRFIIGSSVPDCRLGSKNEKYYIATFTIAFIWTSLFSFFITNIADHFVTLLNLPKALGFFGVVIVAFGAEVPDTINAITVSRRGFGSMATSACIGSQIINICLGLGLPWTISGLAGVSLSFGDTHEFVSLAAYVQMAAVVAVFSVTILFALCIGKKRVEISRLKASCLLICYGICIGALAFATFT